MHPLSTHWRPRRPLSPLLGEQCILGERQDGTVCPILSRTRERDERTLMVVVGKAYNRRGVNGREVGQQETKHDVINVSVAVGSTVKQPGYHIILEDDPLAQTKDDSSGCVQIYPSLPLNVLR